MTLKNNAALNHGVEEWDAILPESFRNLTANANPVKMDNVEKEMLMGPYP